jgi:hypothetical protein
MQEAEALHGGVTRSRHGHNRSHHMMLGMMIVSAHTFLAVRLYEDDE